MEFVTTKDAPAAIGPYTQAVIAGDFVFASGQIPLDPETMEIVGDDVKAQTDQVLRNLAAVLEQAGAGLSKVVKSTVYLANISDFQAMNEVYAKHFGEHRPARAALQAGALPKGALVEIEAIAIRS
ncbi:MAG: RidA family protein [Gemmatimonadales bacterium]|jgi:2-iminobutanoate/2-iminopropanoate deaminase